MKKYVCRKKKKEIRLGKEQKEREKRTHRKQDKVTGET
jgi:hypothetical protein